MKHGNQFYMELPRDVFHPAYDGMSKNAKWLFIVLNELEQRFIGIDGYDSSDFFLRTDKQLCNDTGFSICTLKKAKAELKCYPELVKISRGAWVYKDTKKSSIQQPTRFTIVAGTQSNPRIEAYKREHQEDD